MRYNTGVSTITNAETNLMTVDPEKAAKVAAMLVNNYTSYVTPVREVIVNGLEAVEGMKDGLVTVEFDSTHENMESIFSNRADDGDVSYIINITDNGRGMSHDFAKNKFVHLTASSKDDSDNTIGGFGIGAKAVSSISHHTVFRTVQDGIATVIVFGMSDKGATTSVSEPMEVAEPNGTSVAIHVESDVFYSIMDNIEEQFLNYLDPNTPLRVTHDVKVFPIGSKSRDISYTYTHDNGTTINMIVDKERTYYGFGRSDKKQMIRCVGMPYPMIDSITGMELSSMMDSEMNNVIPDLYVNSGATSFIVDVQPKDITIDSSRERVADTNHLRQTIKVAFRAAMNNYISEFAEKLKSAENGEEFLSLINGGYSCVQFNHSSPLRNAVSMADSYGSIIAGKGENDGEGILVIKSGDDFRGASNRLSRIDKNTIYQMFDAYRATSISNVLDASSDMEEALGIDTNGHICMMVDTENARSIVTVNSTSGSVQNDYLPAKFLSRFNKDDEINLPLEIVKWRFGIDTTQADKTYTQIRKSMMARGRASGKGGSSAKKRVIFHYIDGDEIKTVTAGKAKEVFAKWKKEGIDTAVVLRDNKENIIEYYGEEMRNLDYTIKTLHGTNHVVVFIAAKRYDTMDKNQRILKDKLDGTDIKLNIDILANRGIYDASNRVMEGASGNIGYLFFETGLDSWTSTGDRGHTFDAGMGNKALDIELNNGKTLKETLVEFLMLDKDKYDEQHERIASLANVRKKNGGDTSSRLMVTPRELFGAMSSIYVAADEGIEKLDDLLADGATIEEHDKRAEVVCDVTSVLCNKDNQYRHYTADELKDTLSDIFEASQEIIDNPDSILSKIITG